ncbi:hypothetical protein C942_00512 [Photobacterium marinum]|uniref:Uncharacterized protein n=1 Tax=Photobacterium marinum TaxID=1056511 RepID=L8JB33_9GAMM|nr:hypothetical protein [Photobacterium marinum]ELR66070.1 hypothetical protein C942_00512 [Photobacterium marinum]
MAIVVKVDKSQILSGQTSDSYVVRKQAGSTIIVRSQILDKTKSLRELKDFPDSYTGAAGKVIAVDKNEIGVYFKEISPSSLNVYTKEEVNKDIENLQLNKANLKDSNTFTSNQTVKGDITISQNEDKANTTTFKVIDGGLNVDLVNQNESQIVNFNLSNLDQSRSSDKGKDSNSGLIKFQQNKEGTKILVGNDEVLTTETVSKNIPTQGVMEAMLAANNDRFAASGFVHMGQNYPPATGIINDGMWSYIHGAFPNRLFLGATSKPNAHLGGSKTVTPYVNIAGFISNLANINSINESQLVFPEAEKGTRTYNSKTGETVDYLTDIDPKYGDVAPTVSEAVSRAWEFELKNGDFRFEDSHWSKQGGGIFDLSGGRAKISGRNAFIETSSRISFVAGEEYVIAGYVSELVGSVQFRVRDTSGYQLAKSISSNGYHEVKFTATTTGSFSLLFYCSGTGATVELRNCSVRKASEQVVTERVDLVAIEAFMRPIHKGDHVYPNGCIQSLATKMNGIVTSDDASRPDSFFAMYDGQVGLRGRGVNFHACSANDQDVLTNDPDNNIYRMVDGTICQWSIRARTFKGVGNGDWFNTMPLATDLKFNNVNFVKPQGIKDGIESPFGEHNKGSSGYFAKSSNVKFNGGAGVFGAINPSNTGYDKTIAYNGLCFLLPICTVPRLNQGADHPSLNPMGTAGWRRGDGDSNTYTWWGVSSHLQKTSKDCFKYLPSGSQEGGGGNWGGQIGHSPKRPDGRFHNAIYADGLGGVNDLRLSAHKVTAEDYARVDAKVKAGTYRGAEKLKLIRISQNPTLNTVSTTPYWFLDNKFVGLVDNGEFTKVHIVDGNTVIASLQRHELFYTTAKLDGASNEVYIRTKDSYPRTPDTYIVFEMEADISVSGEFQMTEVIGSPDNIVKCETLKNGWLGVWNPIIPDGNPATWFKFSRKSFVKTSSGVNTKDNGLTWVNSTPYIDPITNATTLGGHNAAGRIGVYPYKAFAHQVEDCNNSPVQDFIAGIGDVFATQAYLSQRGGLLAEALITKIPTATAAKRYLQTLALQTKTLLDNKLNSDSIYSCQHVEVSMLGGDNSPAVKCLDTRSAVNDQAYLDYHFKELVWDETSKSWGDESNQMPIGNKTAVMTDNNGNSVLFGTKRLTMPIGWL